jgi:MFS family permease
LDRQNDAGYVAGLLASALPFGRVPTATLWGLLADRIGNKRAMIMSMVSICVGNVLFGFCTNLYAAIACRGLLLGALNGWTVIQGPLCMEVGGHEKQAHVLGLIFGGGTAISAEGCEFDS